MKIGDKVVADDGSVSIKGKVIKETPQQYKIRLAFPYFFITVFAYKKDVVKDA